MVVLTVAVVTTVVATGGAASPAVVGAVVEGVAAGASGAVAATTGAATTGAAVAGATATATAAGAVTGAVATGSGAGVAVGSAVGGATAAGVSSCGAGASTAVATGAALGPIGWLVLGAENDLGNKYEVTFDCWKSVVHDQSKEPSNGRLLKDVLSDSRVEGYEIINSRKMKYPEIKVKNVWKEEFQIEYVILPWGELAAHAARIQ